jgi:hypothetical protein
MRATLLLLAVSGNAGIIFGQDPPAPPCLPQTAPCPDSVMSPYDPGALSQQMQAMQPQASLPQSSQSLVSAVGPCDSPGVSDTGGGVGYAADAGA